MKSEHIPCVLFLLFLIGLTTVKLGGTQWEKFKSALLGKPQESPLVVINSGESSRGDLEIRTAMMGGKTYKPLKTFLEIPGIDMPRLLSLEDVDLVDSTPVIGVECEGDEIAFVEDKMTAPETSVINLNIKQSKSLSVTFLRQANSVRVFASDSPEPIPLGFGGIDIDDQIVLLFKGQRYGQESTELPLADHPFQRTDLGSWKALHPNTKVCLPTVQAPALHKRG